MHDKKPTDMQLALALIKHAPNLSVHGLKNIIDNWKDKQVTDAHVPICMGKPLLSKMRPCLQASCWQESNIVDDATRFRSRT